MERTFIDLGLPSRTLWATENEPGYHQFDKAVKTFGDMLPSAEAWEELFDQCRHEWDNKRTGLVLTGPNGNTLFLPADGWKGWNKETEELNEKVYYDACHGVHGCYWSSSRFEYGDVSLSVCFCKDYVDPQDLNDDLDGFSIRLCKQA